MKIAIERGRSPSQKELERQQLQKFASQVTDEAHWAHILASASSEASREELERVIGPLLDFRRAAVCTTPECGSGEIGQYRPVLEVRSPLAPEEVAWVPIEGLRLCTSCKQEARLEDLLTDDIWTQVMGAWTDPTLPPVRRLTTLTWDRVH